MAVEQSDLYRKGVEFLISWWVGTQNLRKRIEVAFKYIDGDMWSTADRLVMAAEGRPTVTMNEILPQVELLCGVQRGMNLEFVTQPKGVEDRRFSEIGSSVLKAAQDFGRMGRTNNEVFDKGIIGGMGVFEILHSFDNVDDLVWGEITNESIDPLSFVFDPWAGRPDLQDGRFMGKLVWMNEDEFKEQYPGSPFPSDTSDWVTSLRAVFDDSQGLGTAESLQKEMFDAENKKARIAYLYYKVPVTRWFVIDSSTGDVGEGFTSKQEASNSLNRTISDTIEDELGSLVTLLTPEGVFIVDENQPEVPVLPTPFQTEDEAQGLIDSLKADRKAELKDNFIVIKRGVKQVKWVALSSLGVVDSGDSEFDDRKYPYAVYISRKFSNQIESIQGIVYPNIDALDEINKRYSNLLAHLNSSAHSGWFNRAVGGADSKKLRQVGSRPGIVVDYQAIKPEQIRPVELSQGHFLLLDTNIRGLQRRTGVNAELTGQTTQATVSGRAISARQQGGLTANRARLVNYEDFLLDEAELVLSRVQQFYPPEKIRRIIGLYELQSPLGQLGQPLFTNPLGEQISEEETYSLLEKFKTIRYDLALKLVQATDTERQKQWEKMVEIAGLLASTGRPLGLATMTALADGADVPSRFAEAIKQDMMQPPDPNNLAPGGPADAANQTISNIRGGKAGGSPSPVDGLQ